MINVVARAVVQNFAVDFIYFWIPVNEKLYAINNFN